VMAVASDSTGRGCGRFDELVLRGWSARGAQADDDDGVALVKIDRPAGALELAEGAVPDAAGFGDPRGARRDSFRRRRYRRVRFLVLVPGWRPVRLWPPARSTAHVPLGRPDQSLRAMVCVVKQFRSAARMGNPDGHQAGRSGGNALTELP
jgi:hypothetical protein